MLFKAEVKPQMPSFRSARAEGNSKELSQVQKKKKPLKLSSQWRLPEAGEILEVREDGGNLRRVDRGGGHLRIEIILIDPHPNVRIDEDRTDLKTATGSFS